MGKFNFSNITFDVNGFKKLINDLNFFVNNIDATNVKNLNKTPISSTDGNTVYGTTHIILEGSSGNNESNFKAQNYNLTFKGGLLVDSTVKASLGITGSFTIGTATIDVLDGIITSLTT